MHERLLSSARAKKNACQRDPERIRVAPEDVFVGRPPALVDAA